MVNILKTILIRSECWIIWHEFQSRFFHQSLFSLLCFAKLCCDNNQAQIDHEEWTNDNQENKVYEWKERMSIHHIVHNINPPFKWYHLFNVLLLFHSRSLAPPRRHLFESSLEKTEFKTVLKNGNPCIANIIEWNCSFEWIFRSSPTFRIVLIPINAGLISTSIWMCHWVHSVFIFFEHISTIIEIDCTITFSFLDTIGFQKTWGTSE